MDGRVFLLIALALIGAQAVHWLLTPMAHPDASGLRTAGVVLQAIAGFGGAVWLATRRSKGRPML
jgi:hypothetical protein